MSIIYYFFYRTFNIRSIVFGLRMFQFLTIVHTSFVQKFLWKLKMIDEIWTERFNVSFFFRIEKQKELELLIYPL